MNTAGGFAIRSVLDESIKNLRAHGAFCIVLVAVSFFCAATTTAVTMREVNDLHEAQIELENRGINVLSVTARNGKPISGERCDRLTSVPGVHIAGGRTGYSEVAHPDDRALRIPLVSATVGYVSIIWPDTVGVRNSPGGIVGSSLASALALDDESFIAIDRAGHVSTHPVAIVANNSQRSERYDGYLALFDVPTAPVYECLVESDRGAKESVRDLLGTWFEEDVIAVPLFELPAVGKSPQQQLESRYSAYVPYVAAAISIVCLAGFWLARRRDFALYRLLGLTNIKLMWALSTEALLLTIVPSTMGILAVLVAHQGENATITVMIAAIDAATYGSALLLSPVIGLWLVGTKEPAEALLDI